MNDKVVLKGMAAEAIIENVFICKHDDTVVVALKEQQTCPMCDKPMENAGWFESATSQGPTEGDNTT